jgi:hypothetical protein
VIGVEAPALMPIPAPGRALDPVDVEDPEIGREAIELALSGALARAHRETLILRTSA